MTRELREAGDFSRHTSLVAVEEGKVVGCILFIDITLTDQTGRKIKTVTLTPLGILTEYQGRGIGRALIEQGLEEVKRRGYEAVLLIGDPALYGKFGFTSRLTENITGAYPGNKGFQGLELREGALKFDHAIVTLAPAVIKMDQAHAEQVRRKGKAP
jgi:putative acetyltransferase